MENLFSECIISGRQNTVDYILYKNLSYEDKGLCEEKNTLTEEVKEKINKLVHQVYFKVSKVSGTSEYIHKRSFRSLPLHQISIQGIKCLELSVTSRLFGRPL